MPQHPCATTPCNGCTQARAAGCFAEDPVALQRMLLPADQHPRRPTRCNLYKVCWGAPRAPTSQVTSQAGRSRFPRRSAGPAARGITGFRLVGGHPANQTFLLLAAGLCVAGVGGVPQTFLHPIHPGSSIQAVALPKKINSPNLSHKNLPSL